MSNYSPPFSITPAIASLLIEVGELVGRWSMVAGGELSPQLRRNNRIKSIQASLAIEQNSLTIEQVTAIMDGKRVLGLPREILEVQNAIKTYQAMENWRQESLDNLLSAHRMLMQGLAPDAGRLRSQGVGIYKEATLIHMAPPAERLFGLMDDLFAWLKNSDDHALIKSCVFHYEFEFIHPFSDGNGRMGRLWQTVILSQWKPLMAYLPVESMIKDHQSDYYAVLEQADDAADSTVFIEFMLNFIRETLLGGVNGGTSGGISGGINLSDIEALVLSEMADSPHITLATLAEKTGKSLRTIERIVKNLREKDIIERTGSNKSGSWLLVKGKRL